MNPVFRGLTDKVLLGAPGSSISLDRVALGPDQIIEFGKLDHKSIVVVLEKWFGVEACSEDGFEVPAGLFLVKLAHAHGKKKGKQNGKCTSC